ncbi:MAG: hypothetical protein B0A82_15390 [Alkalinema sp. CACIAM 70d]|nr:MAG: hypothetical protein B0A82_15390 [Alkalinema sp. CACIAM 70d]
MGLIEVKLQQIKDETSQPPQYPPKKVSPEKSIPREMLPEKYPQKKLEGLESMGSIAGSLCD